MLPIEHIIGHTFPSASPAAVTNHGSNATALTAKGAVTATLHNKWLPADAPRFKDHPDAMWRIEVTRGTTRIVRFGTDLIEMINDLPNLERQVVEA